ncbi:MAG: Tar ligand binding domain-containing protein, partial [Thiobacillus sp.]
MFNDLSIKARLIFVIGFLFLLLMGIGILGLTSLSSINASLKAVYVNRLVPTGQLDRIIRLMNRNQLILAQLVAGQLSAFPEDGAVITKKVGEIDQATVEINEAWDAYMANVLSPEEKELAERFMASRKKYGVESFRPAVAALRANDFQQAGEILQGPMNRHFHQVKGAINALIQFQLDMAKLEDERAVARYRTVRTVSIAAIALGMLLAVFMGGWLVRAITRPLNQAVKIAQTVAAGDLSSRIEVRSRDETGQLLQALKDMNDSLVKLVGEVRHGTETIAVASREIASGNADLSSRTESQA